MFGVYGEPVAIPRRVNVRLYLRQQPVMLGILSLLMIAFFLFVGGLSRLYYAQRRTLATRWYGRGVAELKAQNFTAAATDFRTALLYSRDDYSYQLSLAKALIGLKRTGQASAYLLNLWEREPDNGVVNLELARIAAQQGETSDAIRHYHDAIYAVWPSDQESKRLDARAELIQFLLSTGARAQAQSELLALSENVGSDAAEQRRIADLFARAGDYEHALSSYRSSLKTDPHDAAALAGAGLAAFELARYPVAQHYLEAAVSANSQDLASAERLKTTELVLRLDPFRRQISAQERAQIVMDAFAAAGQRLKSCAIPSSTGPGGGPPEPTLSEQWTSLKPKITESNLRGNPELVDSAMDLVFRVERQAAVLCGAPSGTDEAILLIAKLHEGM